MNWAKGGSGTGRGGSAKGSCDYVLHDKDGKDDERVGAVTMRNLAADDPKRAWREMQTTADAAAAIKTRNGVPQTGRKNEKPVYAIALSWHPDDRPDEKEMLRAGEEVIELLGLSEHQALIVEHTDRPHKHIHIVVNTIHPETGRTASLSHDARKLDRWAYEYEIKNGVIRSFARAAKHERSIQVDHKKGVSKTAFDGAVRAEVVKARERIVEAKTSLSAKHKEATKERSREKDDAWKKYREKRQEIVDKYQTLLNDVYRRKPKNPALELTPPGSPKKPEWMQLAKAVLVAGMAQRRNPIRHAFTHALSRITPNQLGTLSKKFRQVREGLDLMLPSRNTPEARKYVATYGRSGRRPEDIKFARNIELTAAAAEFAKTKLEITKKHILQRAGEKAEIIKIKAEANRTWADLREKHDLPAQQTRWEEDRQKHKAEFENAAEKSKEAEPRETEQAEKEIMPGFDKETTQIEMFPPEMTREQRAEQLVREWEAAAQRENAMDLER